MNELTMIDPCDISLGRDEQGQEALFCQREGQSKIVKPRRLFPFTRPDQYISLLDEENQEIGIIRLLKTLRRAERNHIDVYLDQFYFVPHILEILDLNETYGISRWEVMTDHGPRSFEVRRRSTDIRLLGQNRVLIKDADDNIYEIPDLTKLPPRSRVLLEGEI